MHARKQISKIHCILITVFAFETVTTLIIYGRRLEWKTIQTLMTLPTDSDLDNNTCILLLSLESQEWFDKKLEQSFQGSPCLNHNLLFTTIFVRIIKF